MLGASGLKALGFAKFLLQNDLRMPYEAALVLLVAGATAYVTSRLAIRFLMDFSARHGFAPFGISYEKASQSSNSPTDTELKNGSNWSLVHSGEGVAANRTYINHKAIPIVRIFSRG